MKRKLLWATVSYLFGIYASVLCGLKFAVICASALLCLFFVLMLLKPAKNNAFLILFAFLLFFGSFYTAQRGDADNSVLADFKGKTVTVCAKIIDFPKKGAKNFTCTATVESVTYNERMLKADENASLRLYFDECKLLPGDVISAEAKVLMPLSSEHIFEDYSLYLKTKGIYTILSIKDENCKYSGNYGTSFGQKLLIFRSKLAESFYSYLPQRDASLVCAMLLGDKSGISESMTENFSKSGLSHIIAVSGLHISAVFAAIFILSHFFGFKSKAAYLASAVILVFYIPLTGMSPSAVRAGIMALIFILAELTLMPYDSLTSLAAAALIITLANPLYAFSVSFMLSFGAVLGILLFTQPLTAFILRIFPLCKKHKSLKGIISSLTISISAQILTAPIILMFFGELSLWSFITNLAAIPLLMPLFAGGMIMLVSARLSAPFTQLCTYFVLPVTKSVLFLADLFGNLKFGIFKAQISSKTVFLYVIFVFLLYLLLNSQKENTNYEPRKY